MKPSPFFRQLILPIILFFSAGCTAATPAVQPVTITVSAAASLTESFTEIGQLFRDANPNVEVVFNFAGSQELAQQIIQGAVVDVFASANNKQMDLVLSEKNLPADSKLTFASNQLVVIYPLDNPANLTGLADLARPGLKLVFAGPEVPVGQYSLDFLALAEKSGVFGPGYQQAVLNNIVSYENNVRAVLTKVGLGEADAGVVYTTDANSAKGQIGWIEIPATLNIAAEYPILALPDSSQAEMAQAFVDFVLSPTGQAVLKSYGFTPAR
ncbi:MAG: molybdate ABC transporter substrate-binding protein [Bellilinea sp.]